MKIKFQIIENEKLLAQKFSGNFSFEKYMLYNEYFIKNVDLKCIDKVLIDFRHIKFPYLLTDFNEKMRKIIAVRKEINEKEIKRKDTIQIFWVEKPLPTAIAQIFKEIFSLLNYNYCTTKSGVYKYLEILNFNLTYSLLKLSF